MPGVSDTLIGVLAALLGATLQSATGFGFALLAATFGPRPAVSALVVLALVVTVLILPGETPLLVVATVAGYAAGRRIFAVLHGERLERAVLAVLALTAVAALIAAAT